MKANTRIEQAKKSNEKIVLNEIAYNGSTPLVAARDLALWHAIDRLEAKGQIEFSRRLIGWVAVK
jgi:hypothetical protein